MFTSPSVSEDVVPPAVRRSWVSKRMTLMGWVREFQAVENANNVLASEDEIKKEVTLLFDESERFKLPE